MDINDLIRALQENPEWRAEMRRILLTEELLQVPVVAQEIVQSQRRHEQEMADIRAILAQMVEVQRESCRQIAELVEENRTLRESMHQLVEWQRGETGRRQGQQYERFVLRRATYFFSGGEGGSPAEREVRDALGAWLRPLYREGHDIDATADPFLADLIWQKGEKVLVVEASLKVDSEDILRARQRADTLRRAGVDAVPVVVGEEWATVSSQTEAQEKGVEWIVGGGFSQGVIAFRRLDG